MIDFSAIFGRGLQRYGSTTPFDEYVRVRQQGADTAVQIDLNGDFGQRDRFKTFALLKNITASEVKKESFIFDTLPHGVASGDVTQNSVVLWTRSTRLGEVLFEYSTDTNFNNIVATAAATVVDSLVPVKVEIDGLAAGMPYYYRVTDGSGSVETGKFVTAANPGARVGLSFGVSGDWRGELAPYPALENVTDFDL